MPARHVVVYQTLVLVCPISAPSIPSSDGSRRARLVSSARGASMNRKSMLTIGVATVWLAALGGLATSAQDKDKYSAKVPGGLAMSEFKGYESWQAISMSRNERVVAMTLGNPEMIAAYQAGIP